MRLLVDLGGRAPRPRPSPVFSESLPRGGATALQPQRSPSSPWASGGSSGKWDKEAPTGNGSTSVCSCHLPLPSPAGGLQISVPGTGSQDPLSPVCLPQLECQADPGRNVCPASMAVAQANRGPGPGNPATPPSPAAPTTKLPPPSLCPAGLELPPGKAHSLVETLLLLPPHPAGPATASFLPRPSQLTRRRLPGVPPLLSWRVKTVTPSKPWQLLRHEALAQHGAQAVAAALGSSCNRCEGMCVSECIDVCCVCIDVFMCVSMCARGVCFCVFMGVRVHV